MNIHTIPSFLLDLMYIHCSQLLSSIPNEKFLINLQKTSRFLFKYSKKDIIFAVLFLGTVKCKDLLFHKYFFVLLLILFFLYLNEKIAKSPAPRVTFLFLSFLISHLTLKFVLLHKIS